MYKVVVAGGGCASMSVVGQLLRSGKVSPREVAVIDPSQYNYYQPGYTMIAGGLFGDSKEVLSKHVSNFKREMRPLFHHEINFFNKPVTSFLPEENAVKVGDQKVTYEHLVVATGINANFKTVEGLEDAIYDKDHPVGSIYHFDSSLKTNDLIKNFKGGRAIFCQPPLPFKCGGAPQKIMYLAEDAWRKSGVRDKTQIDFFVGGEHIFVAPKYRKVLEQICEQKGCKIHVKHLITKVDKQNRKVTFKTPEGQEVVEDYDFLHVCPPHTPQEEMKGAPICNEAGFVEVDPGSMRHVKYPNVWSLGDASNIPTVKTAAAALEQAPVMVHHMLKAFENQSSKALYHGYSACPLFVGDDKLMLAEFKYKGENDESFYSGQDKPNKFFYHVFKNYFHHVYYNAIPKGIWFGPRTFFKPRFN